MILIYPTAWRRLRMVDPALRSLVRSDGRLCRYADGGYPLFYVAADNEVLCPDCANAEHERRITAADVNYEDPDLYCDGCSERIESAYAEMVDTYTVTYIRNGKTKTERGTLSAGTENPFAAWRWLLGPDARIVSIHKEEEEEDTGS